ncbi:MAG: DNA recombination protein RmuC [Clostridiales Family XIII bacterium]|jgi:DNA recombination protein RmuC|nr:DNA recombination protein RmuC [Clostridiales Family XIII bacterium]
MVNSSIAILVLSVLVALILTVLAALYVATKKNAAATDVARLEGLLIQTKQELAEQQRRAAIEVMEQSGQVAAGLRIEIGANLNNQAVQNEQKLDNIRTTMETRIKALQDDNAVQLDRMRSTVDEKLQKTLEERIGQSFKLVNDRLEQVYKGLGEMQTLAEGVGDLQKVLSNVKTRGILGEIQLRAILEDILTKDQYEENVATVPGSSDRVEFAVRLPGAGPDAGDEPVYLPVDSKFPADAYASLVDAYEAGDKASVTAAQKTLVTRLNGEAKKIREKYVSPPFTTDFAILFLPFEGLYAEVVRLGMVEELQRGYKVNIAGPTTMAALLNSLQMGFKTLAIQKRSSEVWDVLAAVKTEFGKFEGVLQSVQNRLGQADKDLDKLIGTRTKAINRKLRDVSVLSDSDSAELISEDALEELDEETEKAGEA